MSSLVRSDHVVEVDGAEVHVGVVQRSSRAAVPALLIAHGFPSGQTGAAVMGRDHPMLAERVCDEIGWPSAVVSLRGCGESTGDFSMGGWRQDLSAALDFVLAETNAPSAYLVGFGTGGALAIVVGSERPEVAGVAALASPADFSDWAAAPHEFLEHARRRGAITDPDHPRDVDAFTRELAETRADHAVEGLVGRHLLLVHGTLDELVSQIDARAVADRHGSAVLRIVDGAGHGLRHDPRAIAILLRWLETCGGSA